MLVFSAGKRLLVRLKASALAIWVCFFAFDPSLYTLLLFLAILLHEMGHLFALFLCGTERVTLTFSFFGAELSAGGEMLGYRQQFWVSLGGILCNLATAFLPLIVFPNETGALFFAVASLCLAFLNLVPIKGLDGGRALEAILLCKKEPETVERMQKKVTSVCLCGLFLLSLYVLLVSGFNFSLLLFTLYLSLSIFR